MEIFLLTYTSFKNLTGMTVFKSFQSLGLLVPLTRLSVFAVGFSLVDLPRPSGVYPVFVYKMLSCQQSCETFLCLTFSFVFLPSLLLFFSFVFAFSLILSFFSLSSFPFSSLLLFARPGAVYFCFSLSFVFLLVFLPFLLLFLSFVFAFLSHSFLFFFVFFPFFFLCLPSLLLNFSVCPAWWCLFIFCYNMLSTILRGFSLLKILIRFLSFFAFLLIFCLCPAWCFLFHFLL